MRKSGFKTQFKKDLKQIQKRGKDVTKLQAVMSKLIIENFFNIVAV